MKTSFLHLLGTFLFFSCLTNTLSGQVSMVKQDKIKSQKVAFITTRLNLTSEESAQFWPIYNQFETDMRELRLERREELHMDLETLPDDELKQKMVERFDLEQKELDTKKKYHHQFLKVLEPQKVAQLYQAEHEFRRELLKQLDKQRPENRRPPR